MQTDACAIDATKRLRYEWT